MQQQYFRFLEQLLLISLYHSFWVCLLEKELELELQDRGSNKIVDLLIQWVQDFHDETERFGCNHH